MQGTNVKIKKKRFENL